MYPDGQINEYGEYANVEKNNGINPMNDDEMKSSTGANAWTTGIKRDDLDQNGKLTQSNPAYPNKKASI